MANIPYPYLGSQWVVLRQAACVAGCVLIAETTQPLPGTRIDVANGQGPVASTIARADGSFVMLGLPSGTYTLNASTPQLGGRYGSRELYDVTIPAQGPIEPLTIYLPPTGLRGFVQAKDATGTLQPVAGAQMQLRDDTITVLTKTNGEYELAGVTAGTHILMVTANGYATKSLKIILEAGKFYAANTIVLA
jgi:hypothetical protein